MLMKFSQKPIAEIELLIKNAAPEFMISASVSVYIANNQHSKGRLKHCYSQNESPQIN